MKYFSLQISIYATISLAYYERTGVDGLSMISARHLSHPQYLARRATKGAQKKGKEDLPLAKVPPPVSGDRGSPGTAAGGPPKAGSTRFFRSIPDRRNFIGPLLPNKSVIKLQGNGQGHITMDMDGNKLSQSVSGLKKGEIHTFTSENNRHGILSGETSNGMARSVKFSEERPPPPKKPFWYSLPSPSGKE